MSVNKDAEFNQVLDANSKKCINCDYFVWWDGDYCCIKNFEILQTSPNGEFTEEILNTMRLADGDIRYCPDYKHTNNKRQKEYENAYSKFLEKYEGKTKED